jgi:transcriptional regulator with XRE-family HTH domain
MGTLSLMYLEVHMGKESHNRKKTPVRKAFGLKVRMRRFEIGITQEELAEKADLHPTYVGSVERGERNIALENIIALAKALGCSSKDLMPE